MDLISAGVGSWLGSRAFRPSHVIWIAWVGCLFLVIGVLCSFAL